MHGSCATDIVVIAVTVTVRAPFAAECRLSRRQAGGAIVAAPAEGMRRLQDREFYSPFVFRWLEQEIEVDSLGS